MPVPARPRRHPLVLALLVTAAATLAAAPVAHAQDLTFTYRAQSTAARAAQRDRNAAPSPNMLATVRMSGANARVDVREGTIPMARNGAYVLLRGADQQMVVVNPRDRQAIVLSADALGAGLGSLTNNALVKVTVREPRFAFEELGPGERILGQPTRRVRIQSGSTLEMRVLGRTSRSSESTVVDAWVAPRPAGLDPAALRGWSRSLGGGVRRTNAELASQMTDYDRRYGDGLALRSIVVMQQTDDKGHVTVDTVRTEITEMSRGRVDPALFAVPTDYQTVDMAQVAGAAGAAMDSARRANGGAPGGDTGSLGGAMRKAADESIKENATQSVKNAIGGMFRRRRP